MPGAAGTENREQKGRVRTLRSVLTLSAVLRGSARYDRHGIVQLPLTALTGLGVQEGGIVVLRGARTTAAHVVLAPLDSPPGSVLCDELVLSNLGLRDGDTVVVEVGPRTEAQRLTVSGPDAVARALRPEDLR